MLKFFLVALGVLIFSVCTGEPPKIIFQPESSGSLPGFQPWNRGRIQDHQDAALGRIIPEWLSGFLLQGSRGLEEMEIYRNSYVFVGINQGTNFKALGHWAEGFTAAQDFPRLAAVRIEERLLGAAALYPDDEYGEFFETLVKKSSDAVYTGAVKEDSFWILRRYDEDAASVGERYEFFVLVTIAKSEFQAQVHAIMEDIHTSVPPTRDQAAAINRIKETFFDLF
ncbi:MAG: hypothetical protein LBK02_01615 [Treponema sp.]|jgi:hypothetical protein|nr:hypothetical protein [Treponema sp.]